MTERGSRRWLGALLVVMLGGALAACDKQIVYRERDPFENPPAGAGEFLGYSSVERKRTMCGNCHIGKQAQWAGTAHAGAWATLWANPAKNASCEPCHSVSSLGNVVTEQAVGWPGTGAARYQDVQCEACHGPGKTHLLNPDAVGNKPLAPLAVGSALAHGCGECHSGAHRPFLEEWTGSLHARVIPGTRVTNANCTGCHEAKGVLAAWGVKATFIEQASAGDHMAITCAVCHDPHETRHRGQLRFAVDVPSVEDNLCMKCHHRRAAPEVTSAAGPHSPEGPLLLGEAGWFPPGFEFPPGTLVGSHGAAGNARLCATCHVQDYELRDPLTGGFTFRATGHSFAAIPCADGDGVPTGERNCAIEQRSFRGCVDCHRSEEAARGALIVARQRIDRLAAEIQALLPRIPASEFSTTDGRISTGEGARFNMQLAQKKGSTAHNPFLMEALLLASVKQIELDYGLRPSAALDLQPQLAPR
jgi:predicted CXXCH cytochrome family protein